MLGVDPCASRRQSQHAKCPAEQGEANASQERDPGTLQGIASQKERDQGRARRLAQESRCPKHAAWGFLCSKKTGANK